MLLKFAKSAVLALLVISTGAAIHAQTVLANITLPNLPEQVAVSPLLHRVYVAVPNFGAEPFDYLTVVDTKTNAVVKNIEIPPIAFAVAVDDLNGKVYVGGSYTDTNNVQHNEVVAINPFTNKVVETITISETVGNGIEGLAVNAFNGDVYVANASDSEVDVIQGCKLKTRISTSDMPFAVAVNPFINKVYVSFVGGNVSVIDGKTLEVTATTPVGTSGAGIAVNVATGHVFAANSVGSPDTPAVGVLDNAGNSLATVPVGNFPLGVDVDPVTNLAFVANSGDNTISVINGKTNTVTATAGISALFLAVDPVNQRVYVSPATNTAELTVITEK
jgi:YVTN family beta-propeller protein